MNIQISLNWTAVPVRFINDVPVQFRVERPGSEATLIRTIGYGL